MVAQPSWPALVFTVCANDMYRAEAFHATNMHTLNMHVGVKKRLLLPPKTHDANITTYSTVCHLCAHWLVWSASDISMALIGGYVQGLVLSSLSA